MKLVNPTDEQLNDAFAEHVCGYMWREERGGAWFEKSDDPDPGKWIRVIDENGADFGLIKPLCYCTSADAGLPWLAHHSWHASSVPYSGRTPAHCGVIINVREIPDAEKNNFGTEHEGYDDSSFAKAAVIALLRANGVEVEFSP